MPPPPQSPPDSGDPDAHHVAHLLSLARHALERAPRESLEAARQALNLASHLLHAEHSPDSHDDLCHALGTAHWYCAAALVRAGRPEEGRHDVEQAREIFNALEEAEALAQAHCLEGTVAALLDDRIRALECWQLALEGFRTVGDIDGEAQVLNNLGSAYGQSGDDDRALQLLEAASALHMRLNQPLPRAGALVNASISHRRQGRVDTARRLLNEAIEIYRERQASLPLANALLELGDLLSELGAWVPAQAAIEESQRLARVLDHQVQQVACALALSRHLARPGPHHQLQEALRLLDEALPLAQATGQRSLEVALRRQRSELYEAQGDYRLALAEVRCADSLEDTSLSAAHRLAALKQQEALETAQARIRAWEARHAALVEQNAVLVESRREQARRLLIAVHDLLTPVGALQMYGDLLAASKPVTDDLVEEAANAMVQMTSQMADIVHRYLDPQNASQPPPRPRNIDLHQALTLAARDFYATAHAKSMVIEVRPRGPRSLRALVDALSLQRVLSNLIKNAIKYAPLNTTITLSVQPDGGRLRLDVEDEGPGLNDFDMTHIFKREGPLSATPTGGETSTGVGLTIVKQLTEAMGGEVGCTNRTPCGARFSLWLPPDGR